MQEQPSIEKAQPHPVALFVSDVHLHETLPRTTTAFLDFLRTRASLARDLYMLGDLFEYWAGDDDLETPYHRQIVQALSELKQNGVNLFWVAGNRDFLVGERFAHATGMRLLNDPSVVEIAGYKILVAHGDAQCTDDAAYMAFRKQVRDPAWQTQFLAQPLEKRKAIIEGMRNQSRAAQREKSYEIMDVNQQAIAALYDAHDSCVLIHGHTHRPARHVDSRSDRIRYVLPDWDCDHASSKRGGWLGLHADGKIEAFDLDGRVVPW